MLNPPTLAGLVLACLVTGALTALWLTRRHARDRARLCAALDRFDAGDAHAFSGDVTQGPLGKIARACARLLPRMSDTITQLEWAARHDPLTDLLNATSFKLACSSRLGTTSDNSAPGCGALLVMGIGNFRKINESLGHNGGDQLLCAVADRLRLTATSFVEAGTGEASTDAGEPIIGRLGGDEFAIFLPGPLDRPAVERFIQRLRRVIGEACHVGPAALRVKLSIGAAFSAELDNRYDQTLTAADTAMSAAKVDGQGQHRFYTSDMRHAADQVLAQEMDLRGALERGEFCLHYQPQLCLANGRIDGVEALIRWNHPTRGLVYPGDFIPFAETYGLIDEIGDWVILEAVRTAARWNAEGRPLKVSVNISPRQFWRVELIPMIRACLARFGLPARLFEIEVTEAAIMRGEEFSLERLEGLRRDGVSVALDDFGTGYSNMAQLLALPMDRLKIDKSLIDTIVTDRRRQVVVTTMIHIARELGFDVVAEGVEDASQFDLLHSAGCDTIQGYFIARPVAEADLFAIVERFREMPEPRVA